MAEETKAPEVGPGSSAGWRWFVSCKYPHLNVTIRPAQDKTPTSRAIPGLYARFQNGAKPEMFQGDGKLGSENHDQTDRNDSPFWGIFKAYDPGPEPDGGFKSDDSKVEKAIRMSAEKKGESRMTIEKLRETVHYERTQQNNEVDRFAILKELNWDPTPLSGSIKGLIARGRQSIGKDGVASAPAVAAPSDARPAPSAPKVPSLGRPTAAAK